jgi:hypothetical protein
VPVRLEWDAAGLVLKDAIVVGFVSLKADTEALMLPVMAIAVS